MKQELKSILRRINFTPKEIEKINFETFEEEIIKIRKEAQRELYEEIIEIIDDANLTKIIERKLFK